jgi:hypothetical protein
MIRSTPADAHRNLNSENMKLRQLLALACPVILAVALPALAVAKEEPAAAIGSIRPAKPVKPADLPALAKISFEAAVKAATTAVPGQIIKAELEVEDGNLMYSFEIVGTDKSITEVEIDAGNGKVLGMDREDTAEKPKAGGK